MKYLAIFDHHGHLRTLMDISDWSDENIDLKLQNIKNRGGNASIVTSLPELKVRLEEAESY